MYLAAGLQPALDANTEILQQASRRLPERRFTLFPLCLLQLLTWEPRKDKDLSVVIVRPNFQDSVHVGYVTGLKKFTEYYTSVLCFTTPGDGPRSPPRATRTHEDSEFFILRPHPLFISAPQSCKKVLMVFQPLPS